jgi:hypothetical protein
VAPADFELTNVGRQYWWDHHFLAVGRAESDNRRLAESARPQDILFRLKDMPGPTAVGRVFPDHPWTPEALAEAAAITAWHSPKARLISTPLTVNLRQNGQLPTLAVIPAPAARFAPPSFQVMTAWKKERQDRLDDQERQDRQDRQERYERYAQRGNEPGSGSAP